MLIFSAEHFYRSVHSVPRTPSTTAGVSRCPFRAAVQSKAPLHTSTAVSQSKPIIQEELNDKKAVTAPVSSAKCEAQKPTKDGHCECAAQGIQSIGKQLLYHELCRIF